MIVYYFIGNLDMLFYFMDDDVIIIDSVVFYSNLYQSHNVLQFQVSSGNEVPVNHKSSQPDLSHAYNNKAALSVGCLET